MSRYSDQVRDQYGVPVPGVLVYVFKWDADANIAGDLETLTDDSAGPIANPVTTDDDGIYFFNSLDGQKLLELHYGGKVQERELILVGALPVPQATFGGLFVNASALTIPVGMDLITTTGYSALDKGAAVYAYDAAITSAYVTANPRTSFIEVAGRGFRLSLEQDITPEMLGADSAGAANDTPAFQALIDLLPAAGGRAHVFAGTYRLDTLPSAGSKLITWDVDPAAVFTGAAGPSFPTSRTLRLSADITFYVRADGSDSNTGLVNSAGGAFLTIQKAVDTVYGRLDLSGHEVTIRVADGTYTAATKAYGQMVGSGSAQPLKIIGNEATPANVIIAPAAATYALEVSNYAYMLLAGVTVQNAAGSGVLVAYGAVLEHRNCVFGAITSEKFLVLHRGVVRAIGPVSASGNSTSFVHSTKRAIWDLNGQTLTFVGTPVFSTYLWGVNDASIDLDSSTIVGTATGGIVVHDNGILNASSTTGKWTGGSAAEVDDGGIIAVADQLINRTFYVRTDGNNANDGMQNTAAHAFLTIQGAVDAVSKLEYNSIAWASGLGASITIIVVGGPYAETVNLRQLNFLSGTIIGDETTPANVTINGPTYGFLAVGIRTPWYVRGVKITATAGDCIHAEQGSQITYRNINFGAASIAQVSASMGGRVIADGNYAISAGAAYHIFSRGSSPTDISGQTITITGTPAFSTAFAFAQLCGTVRAVGTTFSGSATGVRYSAVSNGAIDTNGGGATFIPGNSAGSTATGGQYV